MVVSKAYERERLGYSVEGVSSFCNRVTQSPRAMSDTADTRGQRKYRNAAYPSYQNDPNISAGLPDSMNTRRQVAEGHGELSPRVDSEGSSTLGVKKKGLQKIASGAIANIGSVFKGGTVEQLEGRADSTQAKAYRANKNSANTDAHDVILNSDPGTQEKLSQKERFFQKAWRNRSKVIPNAGNSLWVPEADCLWNSVEGNRIQLINTEVSALSEPEYIALQKIAQARLRQLDFRSHVIIPKDSRSTRKSLKRALSWKSKGSGSLEKDKDSGVFAIPLHKAVLAQGSSDQTESKKVQKNPKASTPPTPSTPSASTLAAPYEEPKVRRYSSSSLPQSPRSPTITVDDSSEDSTTDNKETTNKDTPLESSSWKSRLIDALTLLSSSASASCLIDKEAALNPAPLQVPSIVLQAVEHLQSYGLHVLGIFRVGGSKKRMKQMRDEFDSGEKKRFTAEDNPHDVAALFKEYFRDLPEPLLTRDLYSAFLETQTFENESMQITALRLLCCLLPVPNRDTLKVLLDFLAEVASFAEDKLDEKGVEISGNKMTSRNLAIIIGPNILHKVKGQHYDFLVEDKARADERKEVIEVVQDMIEHHKELFEISAEMHHEALIQLLESEPEVVDYILRRLMPTNGSRVGMEDNVFAVEGVDDEQTPTRGRVRSAGAAERPLARISSAPGSHPPTDSNWRARQHAVTRSGSDKGTYSPMISTRSQSLNQDEGRHYRDQYFSRQLSSPDDSLSPAIYNYNYRQNKRKTPPMMRSACRYDGSASSEPPPSPALSSRSPSVSWSNYSTPPSSPSGSAAFASADSSSSSPITGRAFIADESSTIAELTSLLTEVEVELTHEGDDYAGRVQVDKETFTVPDWQLENWLQWETLTRQNSSQKDFLEQETLV